MWMRLAPGSLPAVSCPSVPQARQRFRGPVASQGFGAAVGIQFRVSGAFEFGAAFGIKERPAGFRAIPFFPFIHSSEEGID